MSLPAALFSSAPCHCPGCHAPLAAGAAVCSQCGYSAVTCLQRFPYAPPKWERFIDPGERLDARARRQVGGRLDAIEARFPQVRVAVALVPLPTGMDVREFGFWLFNAATPPDEIGHRLRQRSILLGLDVGNAAAAWTVGYGLEPWLDDRTMADALASGVRSWQRADWARGLIAVLRPLERALVSAHRQAARFALEVAATPISENRPLPAPAAHHELA